MNISKVVLRLQEIYGQRYDYSSLSDDISIQDKVTLHCQEHGTFEVSLHNHLYRRIHCVTCKKQESKMKYMSQLTRTCGKCHVVLSITEFSFNETKQRYYSYCNTCRTKVNTEYYAHNASSLKEAARAYYYDNQESISEQSQRWWKEYYTANRKSILAKNKTRSSLEYDKYRTIATIASKKWRRANKEKVREYEKTLTAYRAVLAAKRRASKRQAVPGWANTSDIRRMYELAYQISQETGVQHDVDHYYPIRGKTVCGLHVVDNLRVVPKRENLSKSNKHPDEFYSV